MGNLPYRILVFTADVNIRHIPHGIFFTLNGQRHGGLADSFVRSQLKFEYINKYLLVSVDCTLMDEGVREDFFMTSRDRLRNNEVLQKVVSHLQKELRDHPGLKALNAARRVKEIEKALSDERNSGDIFDKLLRTDPALAGLFSPGMRLTTNVGPGKPPDFQGKEFPTYFKLHKEPKDGLVKHCPMNSLVRVELETDAVNDYFERPNKPGSIEFYPVGMEPNWNLWNGRLNATFSPIDGGSVGDSLRFVWL